MGGETDDHMPSRRRTPSILSGVPSATAAPPSPPLPSRSLQSSSDSYSAKHRPPLMRCRYYYVGCHDMIESSKYAQHLEDHQHDHLRLLEATVALQSQRISHLEATLASSARNEQQLVSKADAAAPPVNNNQAPPAQHRSVVAPAPMPLWPFLILVKQLIATTVADVSAHLVKLYATLSELMDPKEEEVDLQMAGQLRTWQILYLFVLSFIVLCYFLLAGMGRLWALLQMLPLLVYLTLMVAHWRFAALFSPLSNTLISLSVQCVWVGINLFLPVF